MSGQVDAIRDAWDFGDPAASEARFAAMLIEADQSRDQTFAMLVRTQIARAQGLQRRFADAHKTLDEVAIWMSRSIQDPRVGIQHDLERGRVLNSAGDASEALPFFVETLRRCTQPHANRGLDAFAVDAAHMCAIADPKNADDWNARALAIAEASSDPDVRRWRASLLNNVGWTRFEAGNHAAALELFEAALAARSEQRTTGKFRGQWLIARWCVAKAKRVLGRLDEALAEQQELAAAHVTAGTTDGFVQEELGECLLALGRSAEAAPHFARAHELLSLDANLAAREPERIARLARLASPSPNA